MEICFNRLDHSPQGGSGIGIQKLKKMFYLYLKLLWTLYLFEEIVFFFSGFLGGLMTSLLKMRYYIFTLLHGQPQDKLYFWKILTDSDSERPPTAPVVGTNSQFFPKIQNGWLPKMTIHYRASVKNWTLFFSAKTFDDDNGENDHDDGDINEGGDEGDQSIRRYLPLPHQVKREPGHLSFVCK